MLRPFPVRIGASVMEAASQQQAVIPLCVDLDGTLVRTDTLVEMIVALIKTNILYVFLLPIWLWRGKARFKHEVAERVDLDVSLLPYNQPFLNFLQGARAEGRPLILATAANQKIADAIADHLGIFDQVIASDRDNNLSGGGKERALCERFGENGFDYAGNSRADLDVWRSANHAIVVNPDRGVEQAVQAQNRHERTIKEEGRGFADYVRAARPHQWLKNLLIFVPVLAGHKVGEPFEVMQSIYAFVAFSLCASSVYLLNDLMDLPADRSHPRKRNRPFASGDISLLRGVAMIPLLLLPSVALALYLGPIFSAVLAGYYALTLLYSIRIKGMVLVDVLVLAGLYTIRITAGGAAGDMEISFWLFSFSMFLFLSLAMVKRYSELLDLQRLGKQSIVGRGYRILDLETLSNLGGGAGYMSVLVLALYINSDIVRMLYSHPDLIWLLCPLLLFWVSWIWLIARRGEMHDDPLLFAIRDRPSWIVACASAVVVAAAI